MIYFNNGATSLKKPDVVYEAFVSAAKTTSNMGRGVSSLSLDTSRSVYQTRSSLAEFFGVNNPLRIGFTKNATEALNVAIYGHVKEADHVVTTVSEHNSVLRPLFRLKETRNISITLVECNKDGQISPEQIAKAITPKTSLVVMSHVSNVTGNVFDINAIGKIVKDSNALFLLDAAQSAGIVDIDVKRDNIDMLAFTAHKYLYSFQGLGGLYVGDNINLEPLLLGGGTFDSKVLSPKLDMPELTEAGTQNMPGIVSLDASLNYIVSNRDDINKKEKMLTQYFFDKIKQIDYIKVLGNKNIDNKVALFSMISEDYDIDDIAHYLDETHGIIVRTGLQCAPLIHKYIGSKKAGVLRVSMSYFNSKSEINTLISALKDYI